MNKTVISITTIIFICLTVWLDLSSALRADVVVLRSGGRIEGQTLNPAGKTPDIYKIKTVQGIDLELPSTEVDYISYPGAPSEAYDQLVQKMPDTVEAHLKMVKWCTDNKINSLASRHYRRIIELDPDNSQARKALGYVKRNGAWTTKQETMESQGLVNHNGKWITPQEKELELRNKKAYVDNAQWTKKVVQWQNNLNGRKNQEAVDGFRSIRDPAAIPALAQVLQTDKRDEARLLYIQILSDLGTPAAMEVLGRTAMNDPIEEVRLTCVDELKKYQAQAAVDYFVKELTSKDNNRVNRAGELIAELGDMNSVPALIQALRTKHKFIKKAGPGMSVSNGNDGSSGMSMGGKDQIFYSVLPNAKVLEALSRITGQNFGYDQRAWHSWYGKTSQKTSNVDLRRQ